MPKLVVVNNIPTPYRVHLFAAMHAYLAERDQEFEAWFMARTETGRYWRLAPETWPFPNRFYRGLHVSPGGFPLHFNPGILADLAANRPTWVFLGGGWLIPTV